MLLGPPNGPPIENDLTRASLVARGRVPATNKPESQPQLFVLQEAIMGSERSTDLPKVTQ